MKRIARLRATDKFAHGSHEMLSQEGLRYEVTYSRGDIQLLNMRRNVGGDYLPTIQRDLVDGEAAYARCLNNAKEIRKSLGPKFGEPFRLYD
jgi:hypothetical protein